MQTNNMYPTLEELDTMISSLQNMNNQPTDALVSPSIQKQVIAQIPLNEPLQNKETNNIIFQKSFIKPEIAQAEHAKTMQHAREILSSFDIDYKCITLPPLFVRFNGIQDVTIPIVILPLGELLVDYQTVPDLILSFSSFTKSILATLCKINPMVDYWIVEKTLFAMEYKSDLTLEEFQKLYDITRYAVLQSRKLLS